MASSKELQPLKYSQDLAPTAFITMCPGHLSQGATSDVQQDAACPGWVSARVQGLPFDEVVQAAQQRPTPGPRGPLADTHWVANFGRRHSAQSLENGSQTAVAIIATVAMHWQCIACHGRANADSLDYLDALRASEATLP